MEHYDELGVAPAATTAEIRASYLDLARRYHPDRLGSASEPDRARAAERMARINAAWSVLGDEGRRAHYDAIVLAADTERSSATVRDVGNTWRPYADDDEDVDPRLLDDTPSGAPTLRRGVTFLPAGFAAAGILAMMIGFVVNLGALAGLGLVLLVAGGLSFVVIPLVVLARSSRADRL